LGVDDLQTQLAERIQQLLGNQLDACVKVCGRRALEVHGAVEAIEDREQRGDGVGYGVFAKFLLFAGGALAGIVEFGL